MLYKISLWNSQRLLRKLPSILRRGVLFCHTLYVVIVLPGSITIVVWHVPETCLVLSQLRILMRGKRWPRPFERMQTGIVDGTNERGGPCRESWMDDIVSWCKTGLQELNSLFQDRRRWKLITRQVMDTNGRWSHGSWRWRRQDHWMITSII